MLTHDSTAWRARCDECGAESLASQPAPHSPAARGAFWRGCTDAGWRSVFSSITGAWRHFCPACATAFRARRNEQRRAARQGSFLP